MASFKNIKKNTSENASYAAYKKLTSQDVVISTYVAKKQYNFQGADLQTNGVYSFLFLHNTELAAVPDCNLSLQGVEVDSSCRFSLAGTEVFN